MAINFRHIKGSALTHAEMDSNLGSYFHSASISVNDNSGSTITLFRSESNGSSLTLTTASIIIVSSSYALTASYAHNGGTADYISNVNLDGSNLRITGSNNAFDGVINLSSISVTSSSYANNATTADSSTSASYASNASTADSVTSASYAVTASYAENGGGSTDYISNVTFSGDNLRITGSGNAFDGAVSLTGLTVTSASHAVTASYAENGGGSTDYISNVSLDGSTLRITGSGNAFDGDIEMNAYTASHATSASYALSASHETTYELSSSHAQNADSAISSSYASTSPVQSNGLTVNGTGANGFLYINGNAATTNPTNVQGMAFAYNDDGGDRASMIYYNPGTVTSAQNESYYFGIENEYINSASIVAGNSVEQSRTSSLNLKLYGNGMVDLVGAYPTIGNTQWRLPVVSGSSGQVLKYPSSGILLEWGDPSDLTGLNLVSGSDQIGDLGFLQTGSLTSSLADLGYLDKTESRLDIQDFLTGSLSDVITGSSLDLISGSGLGDRVIGEGFLLTSSLNDRITGSLGDIITGSGIGIFSGSGQVDFTNLLNKPGGLISGSGQLPAGLLSGSGQLPVGLISGSGQLPSGLLSGSGQLGDLNFLNKTESRLDIQDFITGSLADLITGSSLSIVSGSGQVDFTSLLNKPSGLFSGSGQLPSGLISGSGQLPSGLFSGSGQLPSGLFSGSFADIAPGGLISGSGQLPAGILSGSDQLGDLNFLNKTESRLDIQDFLTGSLADVITGSSLAIFSGSGQVSFTGIGDVPADIVSGSVVRELPANLVSGSAQVSFASISSKPSGLVSGSAQVSFTGIGDIPADIVSGSVIRELPANLISGSSQVSFGSISSKPAGLVSGSSQVSFTALDSIPADLVSGSVIRELPANLVSGSAQVSFASISSKPSGLISSSGQLPTGLVSGSGQVSFGSISGIPTDLVSGSVVRELPANLVSGSAQVSFASISSKPAGLVSGSTQIAFSSISSVPSGLVSASGQIDYDNLTNLPTLFDGTYASLTSKPSLLSSSLQITFDDIPAVPTIISGSDQISDLGFSGDYTHPNHSGDVTSAGDGATTIGANKVTHAKYQQVATDTIIGRTAAGDGNVTALTAAEVRTLINVANGATANTGDITGVTAGDGLSGGATSGAATVTMGAPSTLTAATTNGVTATSHTHAITTTDAGGASTIVATDADGEITAANFVTTSDKKLKSNIKPIKEGLEVIKKFVSYEYELNGKQDAGFIAQEVQEVLPYAVHEKSDGFLGMNNKPVLAHLHKAILELDQRLTDIENKIG